MAKNLLMWVDEAEKRIKQLEDEKKRQDEEKMKQQKEEEESKEEDTEEAQPLKASMVRFFVFV